MKIIRSFVAWLGGEFQFGTGTAQRGARFVVLFSPGKISAPLEAVPEAGSKIYVGEALSH
jgi:hypothetical protein